MFKKNISIERLDECRVIRAYETLRLLNEKYGRPYGDNPVGIVLAVYKLIGKNN